jgi:hypothetical protein
MDRVGFGKMTLKKVLVRAQDRADVIASDSVGRGAYVS